MRLYQSIQPHFYLSKRGKGIIERHNHNTLHNTLQRRCCTKIFMKVLPIKEKWLNLQAITNYRLTSVDLKL